MFEPCKSNLDKNLPTLLQTEALLSESYNSVSAESFQHGKTESIDFGRERSFSELHVCWRYTAGGREIGPAK